ncbi:hypothetical protein HELRODRAFT_167167 [Helobdella robusta]|uniref:Anaphase-promoting complex subunit 4 n=1 Tax=Helobdella robusta TaxID=6412 RepID=T1EZ33_HELRO|nr:hypothetical protein HELRODRAFT_167167 [Helobdella robusta]ESO10660.1 hypothetical protein HELRODRAFT_167167 [Helobdella robusta]
MKVKCLFKQVDEKHLHAEVDLMLWSPKMDLIALSMATGEVCLFRLSWQKVWSIPKINENVFVSCLAWRPDGKVLSVGHTNGKVKLYSIEDASLIIEHNISDKPITSMCWVADSSPDKPIPENVKYSFESLKLHDGFKDASSEYLPELPPLQNSQEGCKSTANIMRLKDLNNLNILVISSASFVKFYAFGIISIGYLDTYRDIKEILNVNLSDSLVIFNVVGLSAKDSDVIVLITHNCEELSKNKEEIKLMSLKLGEVLTLIKYMFEVIKQMSEVWEDILLEIESKLKKFAKDKFEASGHSLRYELLRLLLYGNPSDDLKIFMQFDLKKQTLTKLGNSVQNSYSQIQKLLVKNFTIVVEKILFHLTGLLGLSRWPDKFLDLGLDEKLLEEAMSTTGALIIKSNEVQRVIDVSIRNFSAFYAWLYPIKMKLSGEVSSPNLANSGNLNQQEINFVAQFINENFSSEEDVKLEKVGQYLRNEDLSNPVSAPNIPWETFLDNYACSFSSSHRTFFYDSCKNNSLIQVANMMQKNFHFVLEKCATKIKDFFKITHTQNFSYSSLSSSVTHDLKFTVTSLNMGNASSDQHLLYSIVCLPVLKKNFYLLKQEAGLAFSIANLSFKEPDMPEAFDVIDRSFYDSHSISLLLQDDNSPKVIHYNLSCLVPYLKPAGNGMDLSDVPQETICEAMEEGERCKILENMKASKFAISGSRKVACVLFSSRKRVRIFLTDVEEEDEDDEDVATVSINNSKLSGQEESHSAVNASNMRVDGGNDDDNGGDIDKENSDSV